MRGTALPVALQGIYVIALRFAAGLGVGTQTTLSYGYVIAATLVAATASALALVSSVPLTRREPDAGAVAEHVVHTAWLSLTVILAAAGVFALVGGELVGALLGPAYTGEVGSELGRLVVWLTPWMVVTVAFAVAYPLLFVVGRGRGLVPLAVGALLVDGADRVGAARGVGPERDRARARDHDCARARRGARRALAADARAHARRRARGPRACSAGSRSSPSAARGSCSATWPPPSSASPPTRRVLVLVRPPGLRHAWAYVRVLH